MTMIPRAKKFIEHFVEGGSALEVLPGPSLVYITLSLKEKMVRMDLSTRNGKLTG